MKLFEIAEKASLRYIYEFPTSMKCMFKIFDVEHQQALKAGGTPLYRRKTRRTRTEII